MNRLIRKTHFVKMTLGFLAVALCLLFVWCVGPRQVADTTAPMQTPAQTHAFDQNEIGPDRPQGPQSLTLKMGDDVVIYVVSEEISIGIADQCHISQINTTDGKPGDVLTLDRGAVGQRLAPGKLVLYRLLSNRPGTAEIVLGSISDPSVTIKVTVK